MDVLEKQKLYLEYLTRLQKFEGELASDSNTTPDEHAKLKAVKYKLDQIKLRVFTPNAEGQGRLRAAPQRKQARAAVHERIAALKAKVEMVQGKLEIRDV